jgi:aubergine-like protein
VSNAKVKEEMNNWGISFQSQLLHVPARVLAPEKLFMGNDTVDSATIINQKTSDFSREMRSKRLVHPVSIQRWVIIVSNRDKDIVDEFSQTINRVCGPMGINVQKPRTDVAQSDRTSGFVEACKKVPQGAQIVVIIVPNNNKERYDAIKKVFCCDHPIASQVVVSRTLAKKQMLMSVCTKIGIQMACKMGGEAWALRIPPKNVMVVGYDTYHDSTQRGKSVGGFVSSMNATLTRWFSRVSYHGTQDEMSGNFAINFKAGLKAYHETNGALPERVIVFRDGVGDGMIPHVYDYELSQIREVLKEVSSSPDNPLRLAFIIVTKRINTRFFGKVGNTGAYENPSPGTIVDRVVTRPERYEFYLVSQSVRQGTVGPTCYNVIHDSTGWRPNHHQQLAYKLTHLYYNWPGTIRVPAPCQYAHKLAYLTGTSLHREPNTSLSNTLFYL